MAEVQKGKDHAIYIEGLRALGQKLADIEQIEADIESIGQRLDELRSLRNEEKAREDEMRRELVAYFQGMSHGEIINFLIQTRPNTAATILNDLILKFNDRERISFLAGLFLSIKK